VTTYVEDDNGGSITEACLYHCAPGAPAWCFGAHCQCQCHVEQRDAATLLGEGDVVDPDRARELDDRPPDKLRVIANDLAAEARPDVRDLTAERFGRPTRGAA
jgi:hypothetical protein